MAGYVTSPPVSGAAKELQDLSLVAGDVLYADGSANLAKLAKGTNGQALVLASGIPSWAWPQATGREVTGATGDIVASDADSIIVANSGSAQTLTIKPVSSQSWRRWTRIAIIRRGAGTPTIQGDTGVTLNGSVAGSGQIDTQYQAVHLIMVSSDVWIGVGT